MRRLFVLLLPLLALAPGARAADDTPPSFGESIDVRVVNVEAVVTDRQGHRVSGLKPEDFRLRVDGRRCRSNTSARCATARPSRPPPRRLRRRRRRPRPRPRCRGWPRDGSAPTTCCTSTTTSRSGPSATRCSRRSRPTSAAWGRTTAWRSSPTTAAGSPCSPTGRARPPTWGGPSTRRWPAGRAAPSGGPSGPARTPTRRSRSWPPPPTAIPSRRSPRRRA